MVITRLVVSAVLAAVVSLTSRLEAQAPPPSYFPPAGSWETRSPAAPGMDPAALAEAIRFAQGRDSTRAMDFSDQERIFGTLPTRRAATNGLVIYKGDVVATFGDPASVDPTYSVAKRLLATVTGVAVREGRLVVDAPVGRTVRDGGYDSPRNAQVTWTMHLQQASEWEGELWGKRARTSPACPAPPARPAAPAATRSRSRPSTTSSSCCDGGRATRPRSSRR